MYKLSFVDPEPMKRIPLLLVACIALVARADAQVNAYAQVTTIGGTVLTLGSVAEIFDTFEDGEEAILMQVQANVVGANLLNNAAFGLLSSIQSAGFWEVVTIASHTETAGVPTSVTLSGPLVHVFQFNTKSSVQLISFPHLGTPHYTMLGPITATPWNGLIGGVVAFQVDSTLTMTDDITADAAGFRRGVTSVNFSSTCANTTYTSASSNYGEKGEGIQRLDLVNYRYARARLATGGGGGNTKNAGGAGGGHFTAGGNAGGGYGCFAGGLGGVSVAPYVWYDRLFMGGGGAGGQQNNSLGGDGGAGGGMVLIKAESIETIGPCPGLHISADGADGEDSIGPIPDGAGGGGAGGTVYLVVNEFRIDATCLLYCHANGGAGGDVINTTPAPGNWVDTGGGGGGGGQGVTMCMGSGPFGGVSAGTALGTGGTHDPAGGHAASGAGVADDGVFGFGTTSNLPVELLYFHATPRTHDVLLEWATATEHDNDHFAIERSIDLAEWQIVGEVPGAGTSAEMRTYSLIDHEPLPGTSFYRLIQYDNDGSRVEFDPIAVQRAIGTITLTPQPASDLLTITGPELAGARFGLISPDGRLILEGAMQADGVGITIDVSALSSGVHLLRVDGPSGTILRQPVIIAH